ADAVGHLELVRRIQRDPLLAARQRDRPDDLQESLRGGQPLQPGLVNEIDERRSAPVHDGNLGMVELDDDVVHAEAHQGRQQVLDGLDRAILQRKPGGVLDAPEVADRGRDLEPAEVGTTEANTVIYWGWL